MLFQSFLPVLLFGQHQATFVLLNERSDPMLNYMRYIFLPFMRRHFGINYDVQVQGRTPTGLGDGDATVTIKPLTRRLGCISILERGEVCFITGIIWNAKEEYKMVFSLFSITDEIDKYRS
jgi:RNA 3'-terminal phosphate cyclase (ATP)